MLLEARLLNIKALRLCRRALIFVAVRQHVLISNNLPVRKIISILTLYRTKMQVYCAVFLRIILKRTSTEAHIYMRRHQGFCLNSSTLATSFITNFQNPHAHLRHVHYKYARFQKDPLKIIKGVDYTNSIHYNASKKKKKKKKKKT